MAENYEELSVAALNGTLSSDFSNWSLSDENGVSIAHLAAKGENGLPNDFKDWGIVDKFGWSVAHEYVKAGKTPEGFKNWFTSDKTGTTVLDVYHQRKKQQPKTSLVKRK